MHSFSSIRSIANALLLTIALPCLVHAADGDLDSSYGTAGKNSVSLGGSDLVYGSYLQSDGKMLVVGGARPSSVEDFGVTRFNANGSLDTSFGVNGVYTLDITATKTDRATGVGVQSDGKIIVAGYTRFASGNDNFAVIRLTAAGALDTTFGSSGIIQIDFASTTDRALCLKIMSDDRIVVAGWSSLDSMNLDFAVVRLTAGGALDASFDGDGKVMVDVGNIQDSAYAIEIQSDNKIVIGGTAASAGGNFQLALLRLNVDGSRDLTFDTDGVVSFNFSGSTGDYINAVAIQSDGKIVVGGSTTGSGNAFLARFTTAGALDTTFNTIGYNLIDLGSTSDQFLALAIQSDGKVVAGGLYVNGSYTDSALVRVTTAGVLDSTFGSSGKQLISLGGASDRIVGLGIQSSGKIVASIQTAEASSVDDFGVARFVVAPPANSAPTDMALSNSSVSQSTGADATVGTLSTTDSDSGETFTYTLVSGAGSTDNASFNLSGATLRANDSTAMAAGTRSIRLRTTDSASGTYEEAFTITVVDNIAPLITSIVRLTPLTQTVTTGPVVFAVTFSENVIGVTPARFTVTPVSDSTVTGTVTAVSAGTNTFNVTVNITGGAGAFRLDAINTNPI